MMQELLLAKELGKKYYYHGYAYNVPSQFDYKMNFNALESLDWETGLWHGHARVPLRNWNDLIEE